MAETYRKSKIEHYAGRLVQRKVAIRSQMCQNEFAEMKEFLRGQLYAMDMILKEIEAEFDIKLEHE